MRCVLTVMYTCETTTAIKKENIPITPQPATLFPLSIFLARQSLFFFPQGGDTFVTLTCLHFV